MVWDDPQLRKDSGEVPKPNVVVGGSILNCETFSLLNEKTNQVTTHLLYSNYIYKTIVHLFSPLLVSPFRKKEWKKRKKNYITLRPPVF